MRNLVISDLHLEHHRDSGREMLAWLEEACPRNVDNVFLAGDIVSLVDYNVAYQAFQALCTLYQCKGVRQVLYVPGNHEFYGTSIDSGMQKLRVIEKEIKDFLVFEPSYVSFDGDYQIYGATLWFPYFRENAVFASGINDFACIKKPFPDDAYGHNASFRSFLREMLDRQSIVMTHHLPSWKSVHPRYATSVLNRFFLSDEEETILECQPKLWIHGHTHKSFDYMIGDTRVVCNPFGYPFEQNMQFDPSLVIELP